MARADVELIPRALLFGNPEKASPRLSPDGQHLAYLAPVDGVLNIWVAPADDPGAAKPVTDDRKRGIRIYAWAYTNDHVLYVQDRDGDENWHVYITAIGSAETRDLTPIEGVRANIVSVSHKHPGSILVGLNDRDPQYHDVHCVELATGKRTLLETNERFAHYIVDDDYNLRFAVQLVEDGGAEYFVPDGDGGWKPQLKIEMQDGLTFGVAGFNERGKTVFLRDSRGRDTAALNALDLDTGELLLMAEDDKADVGGIMRHPTARHVQAVTFEHTRMRREILDEAVADDFAYLATVDEGDLGIVSRTLGDDRWIAYFSRDDAPAHYYLYDRAAKEASFLFTDRADLEGKPLVKMHPVVIESRDGLPLVCFLSLPAGIDPDGGVRPERPLPLVLRVHGGPWSRDWWGCNNSHQWLANRGYAVLSVNYRGSTGFGKSFINAGNLEWAGRMHDDLVDAVRWAIDESVTEPERVAIMGGSYGGYATLVGLTFTPELFACGVDLVGPSNLVTLLNTIPPYWAPTIELFTKRVGDHRTEKGRRLLEERSPLNRVDAICRPLLIGQGANDPRVKRSESDQIVEAMKVKGIPVTYLIYDDEGHGMARPENSLSFYAVAEAFLAEHLGGRAEPVGADFEGSSITFLHGRDELGALERT